MASSPEIRSGCNAGSIQFATTLSRTRNLPSSPSFGGGVASVHDPLDGDGRGFAAADAERGDATFQVVRRERMQQRHDQPCAGGADRVAERAGAAIDVQFLARNR